MERTVSRSSSMESTKLHQQKRGSPALNPVSPSQTLWSSSDVGNSGYKNVDRDKGINVQVILRCRPLSMEEIGAKVPIVISCDEEKREVAAIQNMGNKQRDKTFVFDKVFGPTSKQKELYDQVVAPIVNDALQGYNCTIFAYGQTGTGKTYTMEGGGRGKEQNGEFYEDAGVIPRAVEQIFDILEAQNAEYSMKVTFIELYNEEITDLLAPDHDSSQFFDDKSKKLITPMEDGKGAVFIKGLEEQIVFSADEIYKILEKGSARKHTAETLLNKQSNRSHSLLTITVQVKECSSEGVELVKCGRLNLVDLAGSENILRSGAREGRAREAGEINKSLLILGRVINALVEHSGHVPYRDSKLTRLLRDSLGGKTKTCIIATVSPSINSLEETLNTLDYAFRAKNIKNRPEINQKVVKSTLIKDLYVEVNHLKQELQATREKNGVFVPRDRYLSEEASKKAMVKKLAQMELDSEFKDKQLRDLQELFLYQQNLTAVLSEKIGNNDSIAVRNRVLIESFQTQLAQHLENLHKMVEGSVKQQERQLKEVEDHTQSFVSEKERATEELRARLTKLKDMFGCGIKTLVDLAGELDGTSKAAFGTIKSEVSKHSSDIGELIREISSTADLIVDDLQNDLNSQEKSVAAFTHQQQENCSRTYQMTQSVSRVTVDFFKTLITYISKVSLMVEEARTVDEQKLNALQKKFEDNADNEEKELLDKVAELLANSKSKKKQLIQAEIDELRDSTVSRTSKLHQEMSSMQGLTSSAEEEWTGFLEKTEKHYDEDVKAVEGGKHSVITGLNNCSRKARTDRERWTQVQESLLSLQKRNADSMDSIIKDTVEANKTVHSRLSSIALSALEEAVVTHSSSLYSIDHLLRLDQDAKEKLNSLTGPCNDDMKEMENVHAEQIVEITENAEKCLTMEYKTDDSLFSTPRKKPLTSPSTAGIDELKTPPFEELLESFRETGSGKLANGDLNKSWDSHQADYSDPSLSLAAINVGRTEELPI